MPKIIPIRDLKDTAAISQMCSASDEPVFITKNGYGDMVLMQDVYAKLAKAENEFREGKAVDARTATKELRAKHGL